VCERERERGMSLISTNDFLEENHKINVDPISFASNQLFKINQDFSSNKKSLGDVRWKNSFFKIK
jgi:hypothetical protein